MAALTGVLLPRVEPGSPQWLQTMSASKIAAVVGLSPYESRFSLWHKMAGLIDQEPESDIMRRGHYLEPALAAWWADQHPDHTVTETGTWAHPDRPWQTASPDRLAHDTAPGGDTVLLELKTAANADEWGAPGTDQVPVGYRAQVMWQMDTTGARVCHIAVLTAYLVFTEYTVRYDPTEAAFLREQATQFMDSLPGGPAERRPDLDAHAATYVAVRHLHPDIDPVDIDLDRDLVAQYQAAVRAEKHAKAAKGHLTTLIADAMGNARRGTFLGATVATRVPGKNGAPPYIKAGPVPDGPPTPETQETAA